MVGVLLCGAFNGNSNAGLGALSRVFDRMDRSMPSSNHRSDCPAWRVISTEFFDAHANDASDAIGCAINTPIDGHFSGVPGADDDAIGGTFMIEHPDAPHGAVSDLVIGFCGVLSNGANANDAAFNEARIALLGQCPW